MTDLQDRAADDLASHFHFREYAELLSLTVDDVLDMAQVLDWPVGSADELEEKLLIKLHQDTRLMNRALEIRTEQMQVEHEERRRRSA